MRMLNLIPLSRKPLLWGSIACAMGALFYCYELVLRVMPGVLQSELTEAFGHISAATFGQLAALYYFAYTPMQLPVGMLMDRFGPRRLLSFACLCCTIGSLMFTDSSSLPIAGCGRLLVGLGSSFAFVGVLFLAVHWLPRRYFSLVTGLATTLGMAGVMYSEIKITELSVSSGLHHVLGMMVVLGAILTCFILLVVRDGPGGTEVKSQPLREFIIQIWRVLVSPQVWLIGLVGACLYTSLSVFGELWGKSYLELAHHLTKMEAAKSISLMFFGWAVGAPLAGYWSDRTGRRVFPLVVGAFLSMICICMVLYCPNLSLFSLNSLLFLYGLFSGTEILVFIMAKENSGALISGTVFAATNMIVSLGGVVFQPMVGVLLDTFGHRHGVAGEYVYGVMDYQWALSVLPLSLLLVVFLGFFLKDHPREQGNG